MSLSPNDFSTFFREVHGYEPFPWQRRLLEHVAKHGGWPEILDLPTGSGKTAALDVALFHLALEAERGEARRAPVRIIFLVDRRLVVDDAFTRAERLSKALQSPPGPITLHMAERLASLSAEGPGSKDRRPVIARRVRGGLPREDDWARTPSQPTILCSTVDQIGSRLLFRGYGVSDSMKPVHAGLIGSDSLILLDEAHLAEPLRQTLQWIEIYRGERWREAQQTTPWGVAVLTATPGEKASIGFALDDEDRRHPVLKKRLTASKPAHLVDLMKVKTKEESVAAEGGEDADLALARRASAIVAEVRRTLEHFRAASNGATAPAVGVVMNRVARARAVHERVCAEFRPEIESGKIGKPILLIGPARPVERDKLAQALDPIRTRMWKEGEKRALEKPFLLIATQCIEAGVDIDLDALITEAAALDALRQRFGRLNRAGRDIVPYAAITAAKADLSTKADDPVYGEALRQTWARLEESAKRTSERIVDFGLAAFDVVTSNEVLSPKPDAPVLMPAHVDLLSQTSPIPAADPEVALYLHGPDRQPDSISVVWRADIDSRETNVDEVRRLRRLLMFAPPRSAEAIELPLWAVRRWLNQAGATDALADVAMCASEDDRAPPARTGRSIFLWKGDDDRSKWIRPGELRAGDAIVVPARYGGVDEFGWNPESKLAARDVVREAASAFRGRRFVIRVAPGLVERETEGALADALAAVESRRWQDVHTALLDLRLPAELRRDLDALLAANKPGSVTVHLDLYGVTEDGRPRGAVFIAPFGVKTGAREEEGAPNSTEDDASGSVLGLPLTLAQHSGDVERKAELFARAAGLSAERVRDLKVAGFLHDLGKADPRFQRWLHHGDPLGPDPDEPQEVLAKSGRPLPPSARALSGLPENWRHEALSVRLACHAGRFADAKDPDLVLWLVGVHHGYGRPFFPHADPMDDEERELPAVLGMPRSIPPGPGPQSLSFDWKRCDWAKLFELLKARYGVWGLAHMEAILRLADHRASEEEKEKRL